MKQADLVTTSKR